MGIAANRVEFEVEKGGDTRVGAAGARYRGSVAILLPAPGVVIDPDDRIPSSFPGPSHREYRPTSRRSDESSTGSRSSRDPAPWSDDRLDGA